MGAVIFFVALALLLLALVVPGVRVARRPTGTWVRVQAVLMLLLTVVLVAFLFADDDYSSGRTNLEAYDVEYAVAPTSVFLLAGAAWLLQRPGSRAAALGAPLLAVVSTFAAFVCFVFTTN